MATKTITRTVKSKVRVNSKVEAWDTRFGPSARVVTRTTDGKFVTNVSLTK
jgi:hypothetical protein